VLLYAGNASSDVLETFSKNPSILLCTFKKGGIGISLVAATRVYILNLPFNPQVH
jgi:SNF2 family DNA or RNA helicase